jgi:GxxExxY protein
MENLLHENITEQIIKTYYEVYNELGYGFLERVYQNAMILELKNKGLNVESQKMIKVHYKGLLVGDYFADIIVENLVILELKASEVLVHENELQLLNYLRATDIEVGLLLNFGKKAEFRRKIFTNDRKNLNIDLSNIKNIYQ